MKQRCTKSKLYARGGEPALGVLGDCEALRPIDIQRVGSPLLLQSIIAITFVVAQQLREFDAFKLIGCLRTYQTQSPTTLPTLRVQTFDVQGPSTTTFMIGEYGIACHSWFAQLLIHSVVLVSAT